MTLIRRQSSNALPVVVVVVLVGVFVTLSLVSGDQAHCAGFRPYMRSAGPCSQANDSLFYLASTVEDGPVPVMVDSNSGIPVRRSLGSSETAGSVISSIIVLLIVVAVIWCCCTGRCCPGQHVSQAQATAQSQSVHISAPVTVSMPEQRPSVQMTTVHHYHEHQAPPPPVPTYAGLEQATLGSMTAASASAGNAIAHAQAGAGPPAVDHNLQNHVGGAGLAPGYVPNQAQYPPAHGYPVGQTYPPPGPQAHQALVSPLSNYPPGGAPLPLSNYPPGGAPSPLSNYPPSEAQS